MKALGPVQAAFELYFINTTSTQQGRTTDTTWMLRTPSGRAFNTWMDTKRTQNEHALGR